MPKLTRVRLPLLAAATTLALAATSANPLAAITITKAEIAAGRLVVTGSRTGTATILSLDTDFATGVTGAGNFAFSLTYIPPDCIATITGTNGSGGTIDAVIANCGPRGLNAKGAWSNVANYTSNDVTTSGGSSYRAKRANLNKPPASNAADWEVLAKKGAAGIQGATGGDGAVGAQGLAGVDGADGATGPAGPQGVAGNDGTAGPQGDPGSIGPQGPTGVTGAQGPTGIVGVFTFIGAISNIAGSSIEYVFAGPQATVSLLDGQRMTASAAVTLGTSVNDSVGKLGICYQLGAAVPVNFAGALAASITSVQISTRRITYSAAGSIAGLAANTYKIGACFDSDSTTTLDNNGAVNGWVMVHN